MDIRNFQTEERRRSKTDYTDTRLREYDNVLYGTFSNLANIKGVYCIICKINNKQYIGASKNIGARLTKHFSELRFNRHTNKELQSDFNTFSFNNFEWQCLCECENLIEKEKEYQLLYRDTLYNEKITGNYITDAYRTILSNTSKDTHKSNNYRDKMSNLKSNRIGRFEKESNDGKIFLLSTYNNMNEVLEENPSFKAQPIRGTCNGSKKSAYGFIWRYLDNNNNILTSGFDKLKI